MKMDAARLLVVSGATLTFWLAAVAVPVHADAADAITSADWSQFRGPGQQGQALTTDVFPAEGFDLEIAWQRPLGSGYSGISIAGGLAVTMFADGESDWVGAFATRSGEERWRYRLAEMYAGHDGSDDGPVATPLIHGQTVYALGPRGQLVALGLADGAERWKRTWSEPEARAPYYGFASAPVIAAGSLIVQTGGADGHAVSALDPETGETRWTRGDDAVTYESPLVAEIAGREHLVAVTQKMLLALDPRTGDELWRFEHGLADDMGDGYTLPVTLGATGLLINGWDGIARLEITAKEDGSFSVEERWRSQTFQRNYALPVVRGRYAYGFRGNILTCLDVETGEQVWRSRPPGGNGLIMVDGHFAVVGADGNLVVAEATTDAYKEKARIDVASIVPFTAPSFAEGLFFARDLESLVAVRVVPRAAKPASDGSDSEVQTDRPASGELSAVELEVVD